MDTAAAARALDLSSTAADGRQSAQQSHAALPRARDTGLRHDLVFAHAGVSRVVSAPASTTIVCTTQAPKDSAAQDLETKTPQSRFINCAGGAELLTETCGVVPTRSGCGVRNPSSHEGVQASAINYSNAQSNTQRTVPFSLRCGFEQ